MKKAAGLAILVLIGAIILLSGCIGEQGTPAGSAAPKPEAPEPTQDQLWMQKAMQEDNPELCENIEDATLKEKCAVYSSPRQKEN